MRFKYPGRISKTSKCFQQMSCLCIGALDGQTAAFDSGNTVTRHRQFLSRVHAFLQACKTRLLRFELIPFSLHEMAGSCMLRHTTHISACAHDARTDCFKSKLSTRFPLEKQHCFLDEAGHKASTRQHTQPGILSMRAASAAHTGHVFLNLQPSNVVILKTSTTYAGIV